MYICLVVGDNGDASFWTCLDEVQEDMRESVSTIDSDCD